MDMAVRSLVHVFQEDGDHSHSLVFKHYPVEWNETDVQNYLENITRTNVKTVCIPALNCDIAVAILDDLVYDRAILRWQEKAFRRGVGNCFPTFELLGTPAGIFIHDVPEGVNDERLELYFESGKSGGMEGTVKIVEQVAIKEKKYGVITIDNEQALGSILSKDLHRLGETVLELGPFYPPVHRYILETLEGGGKTCESISTPERDSQHIHQRLNQSPEMTGFDMDSDFPPELDVDSDILDKNKDLNPGISVNSGRSEDHYTPPLVGNADRHIFSKVERSNPKVATVKPLVSHKRDTHVVQPMETSSQYEDALDDKGHCFEVEQDVDLPDFKIELLLISRFQEKYESESLKINVRQTEGRISFKAKSFEEFKTVREDMYASLDNVIVMVKKLSDRRYDLLSRTSCLSWLRSKCKNKNIRVVFVTDDNSKEIMCHSFSDKEVRKGIQLLDRCVTATTVKVTPEQQVCLRDRAWLALKKSLENDLTSIYIADNGACVFIESLLDNKARDAQQMVIRYLNKDNVNKKLATVSLEAAKARCFKARIEDKLRQEIQKKKGTLNIEQQDKFPLKLQLSCEGPEEVSDMLTKAVQGIWHESVDFTKILAGAEDTWLLKKLDERIGKDFISDFEQKYNCFIQISANKGISIQKARVNVQELFESSDDEAIEASASGMSIPDDFATEDSEATYDRFHSPDVIQFEKPEKKQYRGQKAHGFQLGLSEEEELEVRTKKDDRTHNELIYHRDFKSRSIIISGTTVTLVKGPIAKQKADALVNVVSKSQSPFEGTVANSFIEMGGQELLQMYNTVSSSESGNVAVTSSSGRLKCSLVLHAQLQKSHHWEKIVRSVVSDVLDECKNWGLETVAFPPLGIGRMFRFPPGQVAETMLSELSRKLSTEDNNLKKISLVVYGDEIYEIFEKAFEAYNESSIRRTPVRYTSQSHVAHVSDQRPGFCGVSEVSDASRLPPSGASSRERPKTDGQSRRRHQSSRGRSANIASHHRGTRSSSGSSGSSRDTSDGNTPSTGNSNKQKDTHEHTRKRIQNSPRGHHTGNTVPVNVKIIAENKEECTKARDAFYRKVKETFLHEEMIDKIKKISAVSKQKIKDIISDSDIASVKEKDKYKLKGLKNKVSQARAEIYKVLLEEKNTEQKWKRKTKPKRETRELVVAMVDNDPEAPSYWENYKEGETLLQSAKRFITGNKFKTVLLKKDSRAFKCIVKLINGTFEAQLVGKGNDAIGLDKFGYTKLLVLKVERIENFVLYEQFTKRRQALYRQLYSSREVRFPRIENIPKCKQGAIVTSSFVHPDLAQDIHPEINEHLLFHSTNIKRVNVICNDGLDPRLGNGAAMFGQGIYGAEKATKADQYADDKDSRSAGKDNPKKMFLIRMALGNGYLCSDPNPYKFRRPPCTTCNRDNCTNEKHAKGKFGHSFHSVVGEISSKLFREFVVYENSLCYPEYLITYERR